MPAATKCRWVSTLISCLLWKGTWNWTERSLACRGPSSLPSWSFLTSLMLSTPSMLAQSGATWRGGFFPLPLTTPSGVAIGVSLHRSCCGRSVQGVLQPWPYWFGAKHPLLLPASRAILRGFYPVWCAFYWSLELSLLPYVEMYRSSMYFFCAPQLTTRTVLVGSWWPGGLGSYRLPGTGMTQPSTHCPITGHG
jgi:hypothetical protein